MLVLRTCDSNRQGHGYFQWPESGPVEAPDWDPGAFCGHGLHGLAWGDGAGPLLDWRPNAIWLVVDVPDETVVDLGGKVKFPRGNVVHCGSQKSATDYLLARAPAGKAIVGATVVAVGPHQTATVGYNGRAHAGDDGRAFAGDRGVATAGRGGVAIAGDFGDATAGIQGHATAGGYGLATVGAGGRATVGCHGSAQAGRGGAIHIGWYDGTRYRMISGYVGEDGILPDVLYYVNHDGRLGPLWGGNV